MDQAQIDYELRSDIQLIGCHGDADLFNGSSARRACKPIHVKGLLEERGIVDEEYPGEHVDDYAALTNIWLGDTPVHWEEISGLIPVGRKSHRARIKQLFARYGRNTQ